MTVPTGTPAPEAPAEGAPPQAPAAAVPAAPPAEQRKSLEDLLASLDDTARTAVLGEVHKARTEAANYRGKLRDAEPKAAEYDRLAEASKTAEERAQGLATAAEERASKLLNRAVSAEVKAAASGFADPDDAAAFLDLTKYATPDGDVDTEALKTDLADLLVRKPHLGKTPGSRLPAPNPAQGSSGSGSAAVSQLSKADVSRLYADKKYAEIETARSEGRLATLLSSPQ